MSRMNRVAVGDTVFHVLNRSNCSSGGPASGVTFVIQLLKVRHTAMLTG